MKLNSVKTGVDYHIGGKRCNRLTPFASEQYEWIAEKGGMKKNTSKRKVTNLY
jgi:hypothetical protein